MSEEIKNDVVSFLQHQLDKDEILKRIDATTLKRIKKIKVKEIVLTANGGKSIRSFFVDKDKFLELLNSQKKLKLEVKEIILEDQTNLVDALKQLRETYSKEIGRIAAKLNRQYENEIDRLTNSMKHVGALNDYLKRNKLDEFEINQGASGVWLIQTFKKPIEVFDGIIDNGGIGKKYKRTKFTFEKKLCEIEKVTLNVLHPKIIDSSIKLKIKGKHPNVSERISNNDRNPCVGNLVGRDIVISDPKRVIHLMSEITKTYSVGHLDSAYWDPRQSDYKVKKETNISEKIWT